LCTNSGRIEKETEMLKIGHRGAPGYPKYAENTMGSFQRAIWKGANALEFDVRRTKDGKLVVIHDDSVNRTTNGSGKVCSLTYEQITKLDAGFGERIPLLEEVLRNFGPKVFLNIEIKEDGIEKEILEMIKFYGLEDKVIISAFDSNDNDQNSSSSWNQLDVFSGEALIALLAGRRKIFRIGWAAYLEEAIKRNAFAIHPQYTTVYSEAIKVAHDRGLLVNVWTVNTLKQIRELREIGVDGIFSDFPELL